MIFFFLLFYFLFYLLSIEILKIGNKKIYKIIKIQKIKINFKQNIIRLKIRPR